MSYFAIVSHILNHPLLAGTLLFVREQARLQENLLEIPVSLLLAYVFIAELVDRRYHGFAEDILRGLPANQCCVLFGA